MVIQNKTKNIKVLFNEIKALFEYLKELNFYTIECDLHLVLYVSWTSSWLCIVSYFHLLYSTNWRISEKTISFYLIEYVDYCFPNVPANALAFIWVWKCSIKQSNAPLQECPFWEENIQKGMRKKDQYDEEIRNQEERWKENRG